MSEVKSSKLERQLSQLQRIKLHDALTKAALIVENDAKIHCPVDTGLLRSSITHEVSEDTAVIGTNMSYAPYVEFGTGLYASTGDGRQTPWCFQDADGSWHTTIGQKPQPFLLPALDNNREIIRKTIGDALRESQEEVK